MTITRLIWITLISFFLIYLVKANLMMVTVPFYDFDEAHRAENARRMKEYHSPLVPLTGSVFDRVDEFKVVFKDNPSLYLYYHLERPTFIYWLMMASTSIFGESEWSYRLPSFILGMATILLFILLVKKIEHPKQSYVFIISLLSLVTAASLWWSGMYAQLDTGLTFFLFLALITLILFIQHQKRRFLVISALSFALAILSKGQPAVIFIFPLLTSLILRKISLKDLATFIIICSSVIGPWLFLLSFHFGFINVVRIFLGFAVSSAITEYQFHQAPIFWYARWWFDEMRPGWNLFLALVAIDVLKKQFNWKKIILLSYILGSFLIYSLNQNKIWWYVLPLVPAIAFYIYLSLKGNLLNLSLAILVASLPLFLHLSNTLSLVYGLLVTLAVFLILQNKTLANLKLGENLKNIIFWGALTLSLLFFYFRFPQIIPYHWNTKPVAEYFTQLPGTKCLWFKDMPPEAVLYYSRAGEVLTMTEYGNNLMPNCQNYLITPTDIIYDVTTYLFQGKTYHMKDQKIIFQRGNMKLIKLNNENTTF